MAITTAAEQIQKAIEQFVSGLPEMNKTLFNQVIGTLKDLSLDADGLIKPTVANLKLITKVQAQLESIGDNPIYQRKVASLNGTINQIADSKTAYFADAFSEFTDPPPAVAQMRKTALNSAQNSLTGAGMNSYVVDEATGLVERAITSGSSFHELVNNLEVQMLGNENVDPRMVSYSKQVMTDTLSGFTRDYNNLVVKDLGLEWYMYVGALVKTSRPLCEEAVKKKYFHQSELPALARGLIDGKKVSTQGMMPDTNGTNIISRCGGYNCNHELIPISVDAVPKKLRKEFEDSSEED